MLKFDKQKHQIESNHINVHMSKIDPCKRFVFFEWTNHATE